MYEIPGMINREIGIEMKGGTTMIKIVAYFQ
jgi:hypothetical protein